MAKHAVLQVERPSGLYVRSLGTCVVCGVLALLGAATNAGAAGNRTKLLSCQAGTTIYHHAGIRAFVIVRKYGNEKQEGAFTKTRYVCSPALRKPHVFDQSDPFTDEDVYDYKLFGDRLGFKYESAGVQSGSATGVGWVNLVTGRAKLGGINESEGLAEGNEEDPGLPRVPSDRLDYAIASNGSVAVLGEGGDPLEWEVALLPAKPRKLGAPRRLLRVKQLQEGLDVNSLAITDTSVTWTTKHGQPGSAPR
jgi:hypothetical protein